MDRVGELHEAERDGDGKGTEEPVEFEEHFGGQEIKEFVERDADQRGHDMATNDVARLRQGCLDGTVDQNSRGTKSAGEDGDISVDEPLGVVVE